jgi:hypothetical protein
VFVGIDHSLSVAGKLTASSVSLLPVDDVEPLMDKVEEDAVISFTFSFPSKSMKMRERASL